MLFCTPAAALRRGLALSLSLAALTFGAAFAPAAHAAAPVSFTVTYLDNGNGLSAMTCFTGADVNDDDLISGDAGVINFFPSGDANNEFTSVSTTLFYNGAAFETYSSVVGGSIVDPLFSLGFVPSVSGTILGVFSDGSANLVAYSDIIGLSGYLISSGPVTGSDYFAGYTVTEGNLCVPEPGAWAFAALSGASLLGLALRRRRKS